MVCQRRKAIKQLNERGLLLQVRYTRAQSIEADNYLKSLMPDELHKLPWKPYSTRIKTYPVYNSIRKHFPSLTNPAVPGWWGEDALYGWIRIIAEWMCNNEDALEEESPQKKTKWQAFGNTSAKRNPGITIPLQHCFFKVEVDTDAERNALVLLVDLAPDDRDTTTDLDERTLRLRTLEEILVEDLQLNKD